MSTSWRALVAAVTTHAVASLLHFTDNAVRFAHYHDEATLLLNPTTVAIAWFLQTALGMAGLLLARRGHRAGRPMSMTYGVLGLAGLLHYLAPPSHAMGAWMHVLIGLEAATGLGVVVLAWRFRLRPSRPPPRAASAP